MRPAAVFLLVSACVLCLGCKATQIDGSPPPALPGYETIASAYNQRINAMPSLWARGVVSINFINQKGDRQYEQGDCYLQMVRPSDISFTILKLGEQYVRLGCNDHDFWAMDMQDKTVRTGDHTDCGAHIDQIGLPITPKELLTVFALAPIPMVTQEQGVAWSADGEHLILKHTSMLGRTVYELEPVTFLPVSTELIDGETGDVVVHADFSNPGRTPVPGQGAYSRQMPGQIDIHDPANDSRIKITFGTTSATRDIDPDNFDLDHLLDVLGPFKTVEP